MKLMKPYDFERLFTLCQVSHPTGDEPFTMQPGVCWFKNTNGYPDIETLERILVMDGLFDPEEESFLDKVLNFATEEESASKDTKVIISGIQDSPIIAIKPSNSGEVPDDGGISVLMELVFKKIPLRINETQISSYRAFMMALTITGKSSLILSKLRFSTTFCKIPSTATSHSLLMCINRTSSTV